MPVETKYVVTRDGKEIGVFTSQSEAEAFETMTERADKLAVVLTATAHEHKLDMESVQLVARALAAREKELSAIFAVSHSKAKIKGVRTMRGAKGAAKKTSKPPMQSVPAAEPEAA
jgi:dsDNA-binding SOS-regulon protein